MQCSTLSSLKMGFYISNEFNGASEGINTIMKSIVIFLIPGLTAFLLCVLAPVFCCCCCLGQKCGGLHKRVIGVAKYIFCFLENKGTNFIVFG